MNEGVKILLERMKTNPEEFIDKHWGGESKWGRLINSYRNYLDIEDLAIFDSAYTAAISKLMQQRFTEDVMTELLAPEEDNSLGKPWYSKQGNITLSAGQTQGASLNSGAVTLNNNGTVVSWEDRDPLVQAHIDAHNAVLKKTKETPNLIRKTI